MAGAGRLKLSLAAIALALAAIAAQAQSKHHAAVGVTTMARATAEGSTERFRPVVSWHAQRADLWGVIGLGLGLLAIGFWVVASSAGERTPHSVIIILLVALLLLFLLATIGMPGVLAALASARVFRLATSNGMVLTSFIVPT